MLVGVESSSSFSRSSLFIQKSIDFLDRYVPEPIHHTFFWMGILEASVIRDMAVVTKGYQVFLNIWVTTSLRRVTSDVMLFMPLWNNSVSLDVACLALAAQTP